MHIVEGGYRACRHASSRPCADRATLRGYEIDGDNSRSHDVHKWDTSAPKIRTAAAQQPAVLHPLNGRFRSAADGTKTPLVAVRRPITSCRGVSVIDLYAGPAGSLPARL